MVEKVLVYSRFPKATLAPIAERYEVLNCAGKMPLEVFDAEALSGVRVLLSAGGQALPTDVLDALPALRAIICYGTGYDGIDRAELHRRGIALANSPGANAASVADLAVTLVLMTTRRIIPADAYVRSGDWAGFKPSPMMVMQPGMTGRRIGVYGMGEIGRKIITRLAAFEADVAYHSRSRHDVPYQYFDTLEGLADWCSVLVVAVRAGPDTEHIVNADLLRRIGADGHVVNIARGSVIDQAALLAALQNKELAGAGLDVFEQEPYKPDALAELPTVVLTPHIGGHTRQAHAEMQACVLSNLSGFFAEGVMPYEVKPN